MAISESVPRIQYKLYKLIHFAVCASELRSTIDTLPDRLHLHRIVFAVPAFRSCLSTANAWRITTFGTHKCSDVRPVRLRIAAAGGTCRVLTFQARPIVFVVLVVLSGRTESLERFCFFANFAAHSCLCGRTCV